MAGNRVYIKATATISNGKDQLSVTAFAREAETKKGMDDAQITGAASSYARKYALNGLFLIDDTKDADATNTGEEPTPAVVKKEALKNKFKKASAFQLGEISNLLKLTAPDMKKLNEFYKIESFDDCSEDLAARIINDLARKYEEQEVAVGKDKE